MRRSLILLSRCVLTETFCCYKIEIALKNPHACIILQVGRRGQNKHSLGLLDIAAASVARGILWFWKGITSERARWKGNLRWRQPAATAVERYSKSRMYTYTWYQNLREERGRCVRTKKCRAPDSLLVCMHIWMYRRWSGWKSTRVTPQNTRKRKWNAQHSFIILGSRNRLADSRCAHADNKNAQNGIFNREQQQSAVWKLAYIFLFNDAAQCKFLKMQIWGRSLSFLLFLSTWPRSSISLRTPCVWYSRTHSE